MASVGPQLPSSTTDKRKRPNAKDASDSESDSGSDAGPAPAPPDQRGESAPKKPRVIGPLPPPSYANHQPSDDAARRPVEDSESSDDSDDGFGPSLPPTDGSSAAGTSRPSDAHGPQPVSTATTATAVKRDDWMMVPPTGGDWSARIDPTKLKNRKFNTGKGAKGPSPSGGNATDAWHETPQEKQARLQREMMGIKDPSAQANNLLRSTQPSGDMSAAKTAKRLQEYNKSRGPTLYEAHQGGQTIEKDDDPSARAFDREKDIAGGSQINATQRRDMVKKAADFGSRFSSAKYL